MKNRYNRFARFFCDKINGKHVCLEVDDGIYVSDDKTLLYAKDVDELDKFFYCDYETDKKKIYACVWKHKDAIKKDMVVKKLSDTYMVESKKIEVAGRRKPVSVIRLGGVYVDLHDFEKALRVFLGDEVEIYYPKEKKRMSGGIEPVLIKDKKTGESILITPYTIAPLPNKG